MGTVPHPFDMNKQEDIERWFSEMEGYLNAKVEGGFEFQHQGTDCAGRGYALEAFHALKIKLVRKCKHQGETESCNCDKCNGSDVRCQFYEGKD